MHISPCESLRHLKSWNESIWPRRFAVRQVQEQLERDFKVNCGMLRQSATPRSVRTNTHRHARAVGRIFYGIENSTSSPGCRRQLARRSGDRCGKWASMLPEHGFSGPWTGQNCQVIVTTLAWKWSGCGPIWSRHAAHTGLIFISSSLNGLALSSREVDSLRATIAQVQDRWVLARPYYSLFCTRMHNCFQAASGAGRDGRIPKYRKSTSVRIGPRCHIRKNFHMSSLAGADEPSRLPP